MVKDWSQYAPKKRQHLGWKKEANRYISTCVKCRTLPIYVNPFTGYHYRWCRYCLELHEQGPFRFATIWVYDEEAGTDRRKRKS